MRYACSIAAQNIIGGQIAGFVHTVYLGYADSDAEAQAKAHLLAKERWPEAYGWTKHSVESLLVDELEVS